MERHLGMHVLKEEMSLFVLNFAHLALKIIMPVSHIRYVILLVQNFEVCKRMGTNSKISRFLTGERY